jgi:hypothetical protein
MEVLSIHPHSNTLSDEINGGSDDSSSDSEDETRNKVKVREPVLRKNIEKSSSSSHQADVDNEYKFLEKFSSEIDLDGIPKFSLKLDRMEVVKFSSDLLYDINLEIKVPKLFGDKSLEFDPSVTYDPNKGKRFRNTIIEKRGYLDEESNFFNMDRELAGKDANVILLKNSRVILYYRDVDLSTRVKKRILTLGMLFLVNQMSRAELLVYIRRELGSGVYEISINNKPNCWVLIGIEAPIFTY